MPGSKGRITKAKGKHGISVYLSDKFGIWPQGDRLKFTFLNSRAGSQSLHTSVGPEDGLLYDTLMMLYRSGLRQSGEV